MAAVSLLGGLSRLIGGRCAVCGGEFPRGAAACNVCGEAVDDDEEGEGLDFLAGPASAREALGGRSRNLERILESLDALQEGHATVPDAVACVDAILDRFRNWWADLTAFDASSFYNDEERQMHVDYLDVCGRLLRSLELYRGSLAAGSVTAARARTLPLEEGFGRLLALKEHYASLGY